MTGSSEIHPTAVIEEGAEIGAGCRIGPYCVIGPHVKIGDRLEAKAHVVIDGRTTIGDDNVIYPFASIGAAPQDLKYHGEPATLEIGSRNTIREYVTLNIGTEGGGMVTKVGDGNLFMVNVHIAHDCDVRNGVVIANGVSLGGHVTIEDNVVIGGHSGVHQFCRVGTGAMVGALSAVVSDVVPYGTVTGDRASLSGLNLVGLKRRGAEKAHIHGLRAAHKAIFYGEGTVRERARAAALAHPDNPLVAEMVAFIEADSDRALAVPNE